jgi:hypothetical protein
MSAPQKYGDPKKILDAIRGAQLFFTPPAGGMDAKAAAARDAARALDVVARGCLKAGIASEPGKGLMAEIEKLRAAIEIEAETLEAWAAMGLDDENDNPTERN